MNGSVFNKYVQQPQFQEFWKFATSEDTIGNLVVLFESYPEDVENMLLNAVRKGSGYTLLNRSQVLEDEVVLYLQEAFRFAMRDGIALNVGSRSQLLIFEAFIRCAALTITIGHSVVNTALNWELPDVFWEPCLQLLNEGSEALGRKVVDKLLTQVVKGHLPSKHRASAFAMIAQANPQLWPGCDLEDDCALDKYAFLLFISPMAQVLASLEVEDHATFWNSLPHFQGLKVSHVIFNAMHLGLPFSRTTASKLKDSLAYSNLGTAEEMFADAIRVKSDCALRQPVNDYQTFCQPSS